MEMIGAAAVCASWRLRVVKKLDYLRDSHISFQLEPIINDRDCFTGSYVGDPADIPVASRCCRGWSGLGMPCACTSVNPITSASLAGLIQKGTSWAGTSLRGQFGEVASLLGLLAMRQAFRDLFSKVRPKRCGTCALHFGTMSLVPPGLMGNHFGIWSFTSGARGSAQGMAGCEWP